MMTPLSFDAKCTRCQRLVDYLHIIKQEKPDYYSAPVPSFGDKRAKLLIVGLAPGKHGANRTGRVFTGDYAGEVLYHSLYHQGFATQPEAIDINDHLKLLDCRITNAVKCVPPENKPISSEINQCNTFLQAEIQDMSNKTIILALGTIAHKAVLKALVLKISAYPFKHGMVHQLPAGQTLISSYHCSRYNIQTKRLTPAKFDKIIALAKQYVHQR